MRFAYAVDGELNYNLTLDDARMILIEALQPKKETFFDADEKEKALETESEVNTDEERKEN